jgi:restriction system protein
MRAKIKRHVIAMPIPDYQTLMLPLLRIAADGHEHRFRDVVEQLATEFRLTDEERNMLLPSGTAPVFDNRVGWARTYLKQARIVESRKRGYLNVTERGAMLLAQNPSRINNSTLEQFPEFVAFRQKKTSTLRQPGFRRISSAYSPPNLTKPHLKNCLRRHIKS